MVDCNRVFIRAYRISISRLNLLVRNIKPVLV